jgi:hypothetical protein
VCGTYFLRQDMIQQALAEAAAKDPEMARYYELRLRILQLQDAVGGKIPGVLQAPGKEELERRMGSGSPLLRFAMLPLETPPFGGLASAIAQVLEGFEVSLADAPLPAEPSGWLSLAQASFERGQARPAHQPTLPEAAADLALQPYLSWAARQLLPLVDLASWKRGACPACGGPPDFAVLDEETGARHLMCSRCSSLWPFPRLGCPFCGTSDHTRITYHASDDGVYRLYVCHHCLRYLKTIDQRQAGRDVSLRLERIATLPMDVAARQEGYS